ncbi:MAG: response regulator transcription factor [Bdellovibrionaceae bacterium]|nr:response regulator transcription factor [Pseudobdellovibrionaceae bacterium]
MKKLLIEDDAEIAAFVSQYLNTKGVAVTLAANRSEIEAVLRRRDEYTCIVLDRLIENFDTKSILPEFKKIWPQVPIIVLSAISTPEEKTELLNMGVDDYLGKPFSAGELFARIQARSRQTFSTQEQFLRLGNTVVDLLKRRVMVNDQQLNLPSKEFLLLQNLIKEPGKVWSKTDLLDSIWGTYLKSESNVVETTVMNLRKKLAEVGSNINVKNSRNSGYWIEA